MGGTDTVENSDASTATLGGVKPPWYRSSVAVSIASAVITLALSVLPICSFLGWYAPRNGPIDAYALEYWGTAIATAAVIVAARVVAQRLNRAVAAGVLAALPVFILGVTVFYWLLHIVIA